MQTEAGQYVTTNVRLVRELGRGAMGAVWVAHHQTLGTDVAVKVMQVAAAQRPDIVERFHREAATTARLKSPHVPQVFDHGVLGNGMPFLVMELLEGEDLGKYLERAGTISAADLAPIVTQLCKALTRAHQSGVVHRDIKPDNVFLSYIDGDLVVKVLDFGVAKETQAERTNMTSTGTLLGTPLFMSPEQLLSSRSVDHRSDLWATGVLVYKALTGHFPFMGETLGAVSVVVNEGRFAPASSLRGDLPRGVDAWLAMALARSPEQRFQSARELATSFEAVARGEAFVGVVPAPHRETMRSATGLAEQAAEALARSSPSAASGALAPSPVAQSIAGSTASGVTHAPRSSALPFALVAAAALVVGGGAAIWFSARSTDPPAAGRGAESTGPKGAPGAPASAPMKTAPSVEPAPPASSGDAPGGTPPAPPPEASAAASGSSSGRPPHYTAYPPIQFAVTARPKQPPAASGKGTSAPVKPPTDTIGF